MFETIVPFDEPSPIIKVAPGSIVVNPVKVLLPVKITAPDKMSTTPVPEMGAVNL